MSAVTSHCPHCGSPLEADCDFCPNCGAPKLRAPVTQPPPVPHAWMGETPREARVQSAPVSVPVYAPQPVFAPPPPYVSPAQVQSDDATANTAKKLGIIVISLMVVGLVPCLGWVNYVTLILSVVTLIVSIIAASSAKLAPARSAATTGLVFALIAGFVGFIRLVLGGGCL